MAIRTRWHPFEDLRRAQDELAPDARDAGARPGKPPPSPHRPRHSRHRPRCPWASAGRRPGLQRSGCRTSVRHPPKPRRSPGRLSCHAVRGADRPPSPSCSVPIRWSSAPAAARAGPKPAATSRRSSRSKTPHRSPRPGTRWPEVSTLAVPALHVHIATPAGWFLRGLAMVLHFGRARPSAIGSAALPTSPATTTCHPVGQVRRHAPHTYPSRCPAPTPSQDQHRPRDRKPPDPQPSDHWPATRTTGG
jgi:hypothetical protein